MFNLKAIFMKFKTCISISLCLILLLQSCADFVDVQLTGSKITEKAVFEDDNTAVSALNGLYYDLSSSVIYSGYNDNIGRLAGLSSDELHDYGLNSDVVQFEDNEIDPGNSKIQIVWNALYKCIYETNAIKEGVEASTTMSPIAKNQVLGEALFVRAFCYFYLVNLFGDVPLVSTTDYNKNSYIARSNTESIYRFIIDDLLSAETKLTSQYPNGYRTRINLGATSAFLSKVYLFRKEWASAAAKATVVLEDAQYDIVDDLRQVFLVGSQEAIWQIAPYGTLNVTDEASYYVINSSPQYLVLREGFVQSFDNLDLRLTNWIGSVSVSSGEVYFPHKYTMQEAGLPVKEYSAVLRLSEQYLIRAEARVYLEDFAGAISDLDVVRSRAGLKLIAEESPGIQRDELLHLIEQERKHELFTEWGNRWLDLKRLDRAESILSPLKPNFSEDDELYPLPAKEREKNPLLGEQNRGY
jgi:hypothetical protein